MLQGILAVVWKECRDNPGFFEWRREGGLRKGFSFFRHSEKCRTNRSYAIAHGLEILDISNDTAGDPPRKSRRKKGGLQL